MTGQQDATQMAGLAAGMAGMSMEPGAVSEKPEAPGAAQMVAGFAGSMEGM